MVKRWQSGRQKSAEVDVTMLHENLQEVERLIGSLHLKEIVLGQWNQREEKPKGTTGELQE